MSILSQNFVAWIMVLIWLTLVAPYAVRIIGRTALWEKAKLRAKFKYTSKRCRWCAGAGTKVHTTAVDDPMPDLAWECAICNGKGVERFWEYRFARWAPTNPAKLHYEVKRVMELFGGEEGDNYGVTRHDVR